MEEEEYTGELRACSLECSSKTKKCSLSCVYDRYAEYGFEREYLYDRYEKRVRDIEFSNTKDLVEKAKQVNKELNVPITVTLDNKSRLLIHNGKEIVGFGELANYIPDKKEVEFTPIEVRGLREKEREEKLKFYINTNYLYEWKSNTNPPYKKIAKHPLVLGVALYHYKYVEPYEVSTTCLPESPETKGITYEEYGDEPTINLSWYNLELSKCALGIRSTRSFAKDLIETAIHEYGHRLEGLNLKEYKGSWGGETPYEAFISATTGKPVPAGSEAVVESFARTSINVLKNYDKEVIYRQEKELNEDVKVIQENSRDKIDFLKKFMNYLRSKYPDEVFFDVEPGDEGRLYLRIDVIPNLEESKVLEELKRRYPEEWRRIKRLEEENLSEAYDEKTKLYAKLITEELNEFTKKHKLPEGIRVTTYRRGSMLTSLEYVGIEIDDKYLTYYCEIYDADVPPQPEE